MRIPNMCLVLKLDNGKVVSIANEQTDRKTESHSHPVPYYNIDVYIHICPPLENFLPAPLGARTNCKPDLATGLKRLTGQPLCVSWSWRLMVDARLFCASPRKLLRKYAGISQLTICKPLPPPSVLIRFLLMMRNVLKRMENKLSDLYFSNYCENSSKIGKIWVQKLP